MTKQEMKICLVGSAPSSVRLAPYADPSWLIWGCSPGVYGIAPRVDAWFELHRYEPGQPWFSPEYCQWLARRECPVFMAEVRPEIPKSEVLPVDALVAKYGPYFFTSSLAWMFACALEAGATKIALYGVDMAANDEYGDQRSGLHYFGMLAAAMGVEVGVPPESDLFRPRPLYGVDEIKHSSIKALARKRELEARLRDAQQRSHAAQLEAQFLQGAMDDVNYHSMTWGCKDDACGPPVVEAMKELGAPPLMVFNHTEAVKADDTKPSKIQRKFLPIADFLNGASFVGSREQQ